MWDIKKEMWKNMLANSNDENISCIKIKPLIGHELERWLVPFIRIKKKYYS